MHCPVSLTVLAVTLRRLLFYVLHEIFPCFFFSYRYTQMLYLFVNLIPLLTLFQFSVIYLFYEGKSKLGYIYQRLLNQASDSKFVFIIKNHYHINNQIINNQSVLFQRSSSLVRQHIADSSRRTIYEKQTI